MTDVTCNLARESISARVDGELASEDATALDEHLSTCADCQAYEQDAFALRRALTMRAVADAQSTQTPAIENPAVAAMVGSLRTVSILRTVLFVIGGTLVVLNLSSIIAPDGTTAAHLSRHDGIFGTALGIGMLAVAAKPHRAIGLVPLTSAIAVLMTVAATADLLNGNANLLSEAIHVVELAGLVCLWVISGGPSRLPQHVEAISRRLPFLIPARTPSFDGPKRVG